MTPLCPQCNRVIPPEDVNVGTDIALCRACNVPHKFSVLIQNLELAASLDVRHPPAGAWYRSEAGGTVVSATHRSLGMALGALAVSLFWNGIVSVFVLTAGAATLRHLGVTLPPWFPAPDLGDSPMSVGMTLFMWIFLTPFIVIGLIMIGAFLSALGGRTEVGIRHSAGVVFVGFGALGYRRRFDASSVKDVRIDERQWRDSDGDAHRKTLIVIETNQGKVIRFGTLLTAERRRFVAAAVRQALNVSRPR